MKSVVTCEMKINFLTDKNVFDIPFLIDSVSKGPCYGFKSK